MYCKSLTNYERLKNKIVNIGQVQLGYKYPIRTQTMTNTLTKNIEATINQTISCFEKGADFVRITTPTLADVQALEEIERRIRKFLFDKPIIADVHFSPKVAIEAAKIAQKVRINPGNFVDSKKFKKVEYTEKEYKAELEKIKETCKPLIETCKLYNTAIRIGTNHGSLSDRIVTKYGNTPKGLVEATLEFLEICRELDFHNVVVSIKSSNPTVMVHANRLLADEMQKRNMAYPIHLGVTEAGNSFEGRIKSAVGIGTLLIDGIGDTIRVSLTEAPEKELPVANKIIEHIENRSKAKKCKEIEHNFFNFYSFERRETYTVGNIGGTKPPVVIADASHRTIAFSDLQPDFVITTNDILGDFTLTEIKTITKFDDWKINKISTPLLTINEYLQNQNLPELVFLEISEAEITKKLTEKINRLQNTVIIAKTTTNNTIGELRVFFEKLTINKCKAPVIIKLKYIDEDFENFSIKAAIDAGTFFIDGLADGLLIENKALKDPALTIDLSYEILQATHRRLFKTEYISCPSCGRTLFDLEEVTEKIKKVTGHLKGLKIAVMGCIVNGPGEVADADYGYIGSGKNLVTLFKGKTAVKKNIDEKYAVDELINLIKENGDWQEP